jgi:hypothetical protein
MCTLKKLRKFIVGGVFASGLLVASGIAHATPVAPTCTTIASNAAYNSLSFGVEYCGNTPFVGEPIGDPYGYVNNSPSLVKWTPGDPATELNGVASGNYLDNLFDMTISADGTSGTWKWLVQANELLPSILAVKASNSFFLIDLSSVAIVAGVLSGSWNTDNLIENKNGVPQALSHLVFYDHRGSGDIGGEVPLPAGLPLLFSGLGGLAWIARRKSKLSNS